MDDNKQRDRVSLVELIKQEQKPGDRFNRLLGKHDIDTNEFERSLKRIARPSENTVLELNDKPKSIQSKVEFKYNDASYSSLEDMMLADTLNLHAEISERHAQELFERQATEELKNAIRDAFEKDNSNETQQHDIKPKIFIGLKEFKDNGSTVLPFIPGDPKTSEMYKILDSDMYIKACNQYEFVDKHIELYENIISRSDNELENWLLIRKLVEASSKVEYFRQAQSYLEKEYSVFILKALESTRLVINGDTVISFLSLLKKSTNELSSVLEKYSSCLDGRQAEPVDPTSGLNIYSILFYLLRCGLYSDAKKAYSSWVEARIVPEEENFILDALTALSEKKTVLNFATKASTINISLSGATASPWKKAVFQLFEGVKIDSKGELAILFNSIQDYIWHFLFIYSNHPNSYPSNELGIEILTAGPEHFRQVGSVYFYTHLLLVSGQPEEAIWFLFSSARNKIDRQCQAMHYAIALLKAGLLSVNSSSSLHLQSFSKDNFITLRSGRKNLMLGKLVHEYCSSFANERLGALVAYISTLLICDSVKYEAVNILSHVLVESKRITELLDDYGPEGLVPSLYKKNNSSTVLSKSGLERIVKRNGLLFQLKLYDLDTILENVLEESASLALKCGDMALLFNILIRSANPENQKRAINDILIVELHRTVDKNENIEPWATFVKELSKVLSFRSHLSAGFNKLIVHILLPFVKFHAAAKDHFSFLTKIYDVDKILTSLVGSLQEVSIIVPIDVNRLPESTQLINSMPTSQVFKILSVALKICVQLIYTSIDTLKANNANRMKMNTFITTVSPIIRSHIKVMTEYSIVDSKLSQMLSKLLLLVNSS